jgi:amidohydrolase
VAAVRADLVALRRRLHQEPELGFAETRTAAVVAEHLSLPGIALRTGVAGTGVVATIHGGRPGRTVLLRADMDALPIQEATGAPYASRAAGVMHA